LIYCTTNLHFYRDPFLIHKTFTKRIHWFETYRLSNGRFWPNEERHGKDEILISLLPQERLVALLQRMVNEAEFLSEGGVRALSKYHEKKPYTVNIEGVAYTIQYDPGDSTSDLFGGNSNWRGPVWMPINYLFISSIRKFGQFYGDGLTLEYPTGSGKQLTLSEVANALARRVLSLFELQENGGRVHHGSYNWFYRRPENQHLLQYYEYFHGDTGRGLGASHQTGWTALIAALISELEANEK
jgi:hypothetical protein